MSSSLLILGNTPGASGDYILTGGCLYGGVAYIGLSGTGTFTQTGGTNSATAGLNLASGAASAGTYNLNGGLLLVGSGGMTASQGAASFNFGGGTLAASASWSSSLNMNMSGIGGPGTVDTTDGDISLSGVLSGSGGLTKTGPGTLILSASNGYTGDTIVNEGTLTIDYPFLALASSAWVDNSASGGTLDLNYDGTDSISALYINGVAQMVGIWGGPGSGAPNTSPYLAGTGELAVGFPNPPLSPCSALSPSACWATRGDEGGWQLRHAV